MALERSPERLAESLQHVYQHWESRRKAAAGQPELFLSSHPAFTIALSREAGTHGGALAHEVGRRLNWPVYNHELLDRIAEEMGVRTKLLESVDERQRSWLEEVFEHLMSVPTVSEHVYVHHLVQAVLAVGIHGECVIVGRGAAQILPRTSTLRVRLVAPLSHRITAMSEKLTLSRADAERRVELLDRERSNFVRSHFQKDPTDPAQYDLVLNVSRFPVSHCAELIIDGLGHLQACANAHL